MKRTIQSAIVALGLLGSAAPAAATVEIYTGTVSYGYYYDSNTGYQFISGDAAKLIYTENLANGITANSPGIYQEVYGGIYYGAATPVTAAGFTAGGHSYSETTVTADEGAQFNGSSAFAGYYYGGGIQESYTYGDVSNGSTDHYLQSVAYLYGPDVPQFGKADASNGGYGFFQYYGIQTNLITGSVQVEYAYGNVASVSGVPETSTGVMMLLGFAGLGFAGCRQLAGAQRALVAA